MNDKYNTFIALYSIVLFKAKFEKKSIGGVALFIDKLATGDFSKKIYPMSPSLSYWF
jgi:hypothetical protein